MAFDIKLKDGRYLESVVVWDKWQEDFEKDVNWIISPHNTNDMDMIEDINGEELGNTLVEDIKSSDIEYICEAYKHEVKKND